jgi:hypothetical protein
MTKPTRPWAVHPFLLAAFPTLYLYSRNAQTVEASEVAWPLGVSVLAAALAFAGLRVLRLDAAKAGLIVSTAVVLFFSFRHGVNLAARLHLGPDREARERIVLAFEAVALAIAAWLVIARAGLARVANDVANASALALAAMTVAGSIVSAWTPEPKRPTEGPTPIEVRSARIDAPRPDVYLVVLDAYGRSDVLREMTGFDNSGFLARLEAKGFVVARDARANYGQTALALASALNLRYLDDLAGETGHDRRPLRRLIADNAVFRAFKGAGYRVVTFASGFDATESFEADLALAPPGHLRTFHALMADQTPLWRLIGQRAARDPHRLHRERILKVFDKLPAASHPDSTPRPTFTFAHVVAPHPPFVFEADGRDASGGEATYSQADSEGWQGLPGHGGPDDYARRYAEQARYVTDRVEQAVGAILATSATPPIIVLMGDHGPGSHFDSAADRPNDVRERYAILAAAYLPEPGRARIGASITPINLMRAVLDECLGTNLGPVADRTFHSSYAHPYVFTEVTKDLD